MMNGNASQMENLIPWLTWLLRVTAPYSFLCWFCHLDLSMEVYMIWGIFAEVNFVAYRKILRRHVLDDSAQMECFPRTTGWWSQFLFERDTAPPSFLLPSFIYRRCMNKTTFIYSHATLLQRISAYLGVKKNVLTGSEIFHAPSTVYLTQVWRVASREEKLGHVNWIRLRTQLSMHWNTVINNTEMNQQIACWCCVCVM